MCIWGEKTRTEGRDRGGEALLKRVSSFVAGKVYLLDFSAGVGWFSDVCLTQDDISFPVNIDFPRHRSFFHILTEWMSRRVRTQINLHHSNKDPPGFRLVTV